MVIRGNSLFTANSAWKRGGAIVIAATLKSVITGATYTSNTAPIGGAITLWAPNPNERVYDNCIFIGNTAADGGAMYLYGVSGLDVVTGSVFRDNYASKNSILRARTHLTKVSDNAQKLFRMSNSGSKITVDPQFQMGNIGEDTNARAGRDVRPWTECTEQPATCWRLSL